MRVREMQASTLKGAILALCVCLSGCSLLFVKAVPPKTERARPHHVECTSGKAAPVLDTVLGTLEGIGTVVAVGRSDDDYADAAYDRSTAVALGLVFTTMWVTSAAYGYTMTSRCARLTDRQEKYQEVDSWHEPTSELPPLCTPGETRECVGPGACRGGQSCLMDGSGFSACDCGESETEEPAEDEAPPAEDEQPPVSEPDPSPDAGS